MEAIIWALAVLAVGSVLLLILGAVEWLLRRIDGRPPEPPPRPSAHVRNRKLHPRERK